MAKQRYDYKIFPETTGMRVLLGLGFLAGGILFAGYVAFTISFYVGSPFGWWDFLDKVEVTYANETDQTVAVYLDNDLVATVPPGDSATHSYRKIEWWFNRSVSVWDIPGRLVYATELDKDDLEEMDYRIVIRDPLGGQGEVASGGCSQYLISPCLEAQTALEGIAVSDCHGEGARICLAPVGAVPAELVLHLVGHYEDEYSLEIQVLRPLSIPEEMVDSTRRQVDALELRRLLTSEFEQGDGAIIIGLTAADMYISEVEWRYAFGMQGPTSIISIARMGSTVLGALEGAEPLAYSRARKLVSKYIGVRYYNLPLSDDPTNPMFNNILSPADLDRMGDRLPVESPSGEPDDNPLVFP